MVSSIRTAFVSLTSVVLATSIYLPITASADDSVGLFNGNASVSEMGAATYSIPIDLPVGVNGVQPKLGLSYNSQRANGWVGLGWGVSGLSTISRCYTNLEEDGFIDPVDYDDNDLFCLDGAKLVEDEQSGELKPAYGNGGASIRKVGLYGNGPEYFEHSSAGYKSYYGMDINDRKLTLDGSETAEWRISKSQDPFGNIVEYEYGTEENNESGLIKTIRYAMFEVDFSYEARNDFLVSYFAGAKSSYSARLSEINVKLASTGSVVRRYSIVYENEQFSKVKRIAVSSASGAERAVDFEWTAAALGNYASSKGSSPFNGSDGKNFKASTGDANGDGLADIIWTKDTSSGLRTKVALSLGNGFYQSAISSSPRNNGDSDSFSARLGDANGDGLIDIIWVKDDEAGLRSEVSLSRGDGTYAASIRSSIFDGNDGANYNASIGDANGDGLADIIWTKNTSNGLRSKVALSLGNGQYQSAIGSSPRNGGDSDDFSARLGDANGDGLIDIVWVKDDEAGLRTEVSLSNGDGSYAASMRSSILNDNDGVNYSANIGDVNGDGLDDVIWTKNTSSGLRTKVALSQGNGFYQSAIGSSPRNGGDSGDFYARLGDANGDGLIDVIWVKDKTVGLRTEVSLSKGDGTYAPTVRSSFYNTSDADNYGARVGDANGDGLTDVIWVKNNTSGLRSQVSLSISATAPNRLLRAVDSNGAVAEYQYSQPIVDENLYSFSSYYDYPVLEKPYVGSLVSSISTSDGVGGLNKQMYSYRGLRYHKKGLGSLGFSQIDISDEGTRIHTQTIYSQDWEKRTNGMILATSSYASNGSVLSKSFNQLENHYEGVYSDRYLPYNKATTKILMDLDGSVLSTTTNEYTLNVDGWLEQDAACISELDYFASDVVPCYAMSGLVQEKVTQFEYEPVSFAPEFAPLVHRKLTSITVPVAPPFQPATETRVVEYSYDVETGKVLQETIQPDDPVLKLTKSYEYHSSGQVASTTISGTGISARTSRVQYNPSTLLVEKSWNALGHATTYAYDDLRFPWLVTKEINPDGQWLKKQYDSWGSVESTQKGHGTAVLEWAASNKYWCTGSTKCMSGSGELFYIENQSSTSAVSYVYFDVLGRQVRTGSLGLKSGVSTPVYTNTRYNALGQIEWAGKPYYQGDTEYGNTIHYDLLGRPDSAVDAVQGSSTIAYSGFETTYTNQKGQTKTIVKNALGQLVEARDHYGHAVTYQYDAFGNLVYMNDLHGNETKMGYNIRGFKTKLVDPDQGLITYGYDVLGSVTDQTDAKGQVIHTEYDLLSRIKSRTDGYGSSEAKTSNWTYDDVSVSAIGKLTAVTNNDNFSRLIEYDGYGRPYKMVVSIDGVSYVQQSVYDELNRVKDTIYPNGYTVRNEYHNELGILQRIINPVNNYEFWKLNNTNARGQINEALFGGIIANTHRFNDATGLIEDMRSESTITMGFVYQDLSYGWDAVGNLEHFNDLKQGVSETYSYDELNRLQDVTATNGTFSTRYDDLGNITSRTGVGSYDYDSVSVPAECGNYNHEAGPHAVRRVTGSQANHYCYDQNGNLVKDKNRTIRYTAFNKPDSIVRGSASVIFDYGPERGRFKRVDSSNGSTKTTYYLDDYEKVVEGGSVKHKINVKGIAQVISQQGGATNIHYLLKDHLGSVTAIVNSVGTLIEEGSYDAWGNRRLTNLALLSDPLSFESAITDRGFTGQEHMDSVGLIHMNGRVYDPVIARFISPDPLIQSPSNLQSLNRYSYVMNNPLNATDPSGYYSLKDLEDDLKGGLEATIAIATFGFVCGNTGACSSEVWEGSKNFAKTGLHSPRQAFRNAYQSFLEEQRRVHRNEYVVKYGGPIVTWACGPWGFVCAGVYTAAVADAHGAEPEDAFKEGIKAAAIAWAVYEFNEWVDGQTGGTSPSSTSTPSEVPTLTDQLYDAAKDILKDQLLGGVKAGIKAELDGGNFRDAFKDSIDLEHALLNELLSHFKPRGLGYGVGRYIDSVGLLDSLAAYDISLGSLDYRRGQFKIGEGIVEISKEATKTWVLGGSFTDGVTSASSDWFGGEGESWAKNTGIGRSAQRRIQPIKDWADSIF